MAVTPSKREISDIVMVVTPSKRKILGVTTVVTPSELEIDERLYAGALHLRDNENGGGQQ
jgi:hypothetical protein